jgi:hypothetical protein
MHKIMGVAAWIVAGLFFGQVQLNANIVTAWSYQELWEKADLVAIIQPMKSEKNEGRLDALGPLSKDVQGFSTTFAVLSYLKGTPLPDAPSPDELIVKHFDYKPGQRSPSGPFLISFPFPTDVSHEAACWLAYLKRMPDGSYAPISGQDDPTASFKKLLDMDFFQAP